MYRGAFLVNYLLGAVAVLFALFSIAGQVLWIGLELAVIILILTLTRLGRRGAWHQRWLDYRMLAERLRVARCLGLIGGGSPQVAYAGHLAEYGNPARTWMHWHYRAVERAAGLPKKPGKAPVKFDRAHLQSCQEYWRESLIVDQRSYHQHACQKHTKLDRRLHYAGDALFAATLGVCLLHMAHVWTEGNPHFADWVRDLVSNWPTLLSAFMPALGAAFAAIRSQCEAQRLARHSKAMDDALERVQLDFASVPCDPNSLNSVRLRICADRASDLMIREMLDWRVVFQDRPLGLPA